MYICIKLHFGSCYFKGNKFWLCFSDALCGKLFCNGGSDYLLRKGHIITFLTCKTFEPEDSSQEISIVANGTKCGENKVH